MLPEGSETLKEIQGKLKRAKKQSSGRAKSKRKQLDIKQVRVADKVFQWRLAGQNHAEKEEHILQLAKIVRGQKKPLDPILVFPIGSHFYVVDGHHRLAAYLTAKWERPLPADIFSGSLEEAQREALRRNSKNKLPMTRHDKSEASWRLVKDGRLTKSEISNLTTASPRNVGYMRKSLAELRKGFGEDVASITWSEALRLKSGRQTQAKDWKNEQAQKLLDALLKANIGQGLMKNPDVTAMALQRLNPRLPAALIREWWYDEPAVVEELNTAKSADDAFDL